MRRLSAVLTAVFAVCTATPAFAQARTYTRDCITSAKFTVADTGKQIPIRIIPDVTTKNALCVQRAPTTTQAPIPTPVPVPTPTPGVSVLFSDSFERAATVDPSKTTGIRWTDAPYANGTTTAIAHSGTRAVIVDQSERWGELRFDGLPKLTEAYIQFWLYLPSGNESPSLGPKVFPLGGLNDKFFRLWGESDADYGVDKDLMNKVGASTYGDTGTTGVVAIEFPLFPYPTDPGYGFGTTRTISAETWAGTEEKTFFSDANRGRWIKVGLHAKNASPANNDGIVEIFVDGKLVTGYRNLHSYGTKPGFRRTYTTGYLLGALNNGGRPGQRVYIDDVTISTGGFPQ